MRAAMPAPDAFSETPLILRAADGYELAGTLYAPAGGSHPAVAAVFACGGGVPAARYARFARYLAAHGVPILTFDYRGIAASRPARLRGFHVVAEDWSELDCGAAIDFLERRYPKARRAGIAHSIGAVMIGGAPNIGTLSRFVFFSAHTAYVGDYRARNRLPMALLWHVVMPMLTRVVGYFPARALRIGEDIPGGVARQWAGRRKPAITAHVSAATTPRLKAVIDRMATATGPVLVLGVTDDAYATKAGTNRLLSAYPRLVADEHWYSPHQVGAAKTGHFGMFRRNAETTVWPRVLAFLRSGIEAEPKGAAAVSP
jgi:predicted alpha/beta hydrolase